METIPRTSSEYRSWWQTNTSIPYGLCWCGCGEQTKVASSSRASAFYVRGEPKRFILGHSKRVLSDQQWQSVCKRYEAGETTYAIAADFGISATTVGDHLKRLGVKRRSGGPQHLLSLKQQQEACQRYEAGETAKQIADSFGVTDTCIRDVLHRLGCEVRPGGLRPGTTRPYMRAFADETEAEIAQLYEAGYSATHLAAQRSVSESCIREIASRQGIAIRPAVASERTSPEIEAEVCKRYRSGEWPRDICKALNIGISTISFILKRNGISPQIKLTITADQESKALRMYEAGAATAFIAERCNISPTAIYPLLRRNGLEPTRAVRPKLYSAEQAPKAIRSLAAYRSWREAVLDRDGFTCQRCGVEDSLHVHHITPFAKLLAEHQPATPEEAENCAPLWDTSNGITLCNYCHRRTHSLGLL